MTAQDIIRKYLMESVKKTDFTAKDLFLKKQNGAIERYDVVNEIILLEGQL